MDEDGRRCTERDGDLTRTNDDQSADEEGEDDRDLRGLSGILTIASHEDHVADDHQGGDSDQAAHDHPASQALRDEGCGGPQDRHQGERAQPRQRRGGALLLEPDQKAEPERDEDVDERGAEHLRSAEYGEDAKKMTSRS